MTIVNRLRALHPESVLIQHDIKRSPSIAWIVDSVSKDRLILRRGKGLDRVLPLPTAHSDSLSFHEEPWANIFRVVHPRVNGGPVETEYFEFAFESRPPASMLDRYFWPHNRECPLPLDMIHFGMQAVGYPIDSISRADHSMLVNAISVKWECETLGKCEEVADAVVKIVLVGWEEWVKNQ